ncbi:ATP-dependent DNA ligase [Mucisphaera calidilacus]|uniref:DNA ligase (ATP) n=1 Tax=Mucisphaera calidilacus TaxID=2527982 RepID=A0A518BY24_9BACT|nr:ATP-dependent DNA ligase [Mucisphaera calidilacus]QDU71858.1 ATP-dependent DNA ligase [Mucisphaera calidilacus]
MKRLADLYRRLDQTTRTNEKRDALRDYFADAPPEDAAWTLYFLAGRRIKRAISYKLMQQEAARRSNLPDWIIPPCRQMVGDLGETLALLLPPNPDADPPPLHQLVEHYLLPLPQADEKTKRSLLNQAWDQLDPWQRFVFHKLISGSLRIGVGQRLLVRGLASAFDQQPEVVAHRLTGRWEPTPTAYRMIIEGDPALDAMRPYPFCLATQHDSSPDALGSPRDFAAEWKWDGIRAQLIHRKPGVGLWSRGDETIDKAFPELIELGRQLPPGTVLDGEILAWDHDHDRPHAFNTLQRRLNRTDVRPTLFGPEIPVRFVAYDLLEDRGDDLRDQPFTRRRARLEHHVSQTDDPLLVLSESIAFDTWAQLAALREEARDRRVEGLMLKRHDSSYASGRKTGIWWKWKIAPHTVDAVLVAAQHGHGERAGLFSDFTLALWDDDQLVTVAKAYSGLTNKELETITRWVRANTTARHGPVHTVKAEHVFEIAFEGIQASKRHRSGIALRFPRILRWRTDKKHEEADQLHTLQQLLRTLSD